MKKIKQFIESDGGKDALTILIVVLVGLSCFGIGRLSKESSSSGIKIEYPTQENATVGLSNTTLNTSPNSIISTKTSQNYFASKNGHKYYPSGCSAGKTIKDGNKIYFNSPAEAEKAGYELSSSCK